MKNEFLFVVGFVSNVVFEETDGVEYYIPVAYSLIEAYTQKKVFSVEIITFLRSFIMQNMPIMTLIDIQ